MARKCNTMTKEHHKTKTYVVGRADIIVFVH